MSSRLATSARGLALLGSVLAVAWLASGHFDGPLGMFPGGPLKGPSVPCPANGWEELESFTELEIEVRPESPRSVRTWGVVHQDALFVPADFLTPWKRWPYQVRDDPRVRVRMERGGEILACAAVEVRDSALISALRGAIAAKYDLRADGRAAQVEVIWFRITPRESRRASPEAG